MTRLRFGMKGGEEIEITIRGKPKEIAALVREIQERRAWDVTMNSNEVVHYATELIQNLSTQIEAKYDT